jgi:hypothetical protein
MKIVNCEEKTCGGRRRHHEDPTPRGTVSFEVPDGAAGPFYCSMECAAYAAGALLYMEEF